MSLENFLNPVEENIADMKEPIDLDSIIALHTQDTTGIPVEEGQGDEENDIIIQPHQQSSKHFKHSVQC